MWKCIRCEKENQDAEEICPGCGNAYAVKKKIRVLQRTV